MDAETFFADEWPQMVPRLRAMLARAGAPPADRDDLVQETAVRLLRNWATIDPERGVEALARTIATNVWRDQWRRHGGREVLGEVPEQVAAADTERTAIARLHVREVSRALASLKPAVAETLRIAASEQEDDGRRTVTPASVRMARSRARRALADCLKVASAVAAAFVIGIRWVGRPARSAATVSAMAGIALVVALHGPAGPAQAQLHLPGTAADAHGVSTTHQTRSVSAAHSTKVGVRAKATHRVGRKEVPFYVVKAGPAGASVFFDVDAQGDGVRVSRPEPGDDKPVCTYGDTPTVPTVATCSDDGQNG